MPAETTHAIAADDIEAWVATWNDNPRPFTWHRTPDEILAKLARYCAAVAGTEYHGASSVSRWMVRVRLVFSTRRVLTSP